MDSLEIVRAWQINNLKVDGWAKKLKEKLEKIGLDIFGKANLRLM
jgi:hypothetical protein